MEAELQTHVAFHLTGRRPAKDLDAVDTLELRPALLAHYRDLTRLRYDFPVMLVRGAGEQSGVRALSALIDDLLHEVAKGDDVERVTRHVLRQERQIRTLVAEGQRGMLSSLWNTAAERLSGHGDEQLQDSLKRARAALKIDGEVVDCDAAMPAHVFTHLWMLAEQRKAKRLDTEITRLIVKLSDLMRADHARSDAGRTAESLMSSVGAAHGALFDFEAMSKLLTRTAPKSAMSETRRRRIRSLLSVLETQSFVATRGGNGAVPYAFAFDRSTAALAAYRERGPGMIELARAMAIAELEIKGEYKDGAHDDYFASYGAK